MVTQVIRYRASKCGRQILPDRIARLISHRPLEEEDHQAGENYDSDPIVNGFQLLSFARTFAGALNLV